MFNSENKSDQATDMDIQENAALGETIMDDIRDGRVDIFIGSGTSLNGELSFRVTAHINGQLSGKITGEKGTLIVGASGQVDAVVSVATGIINGTINGDVIASEHLELKSTAKIIGNVQTPRLIMEDGAILEGKCSMQKVEEKTENRSVKPTVSATAAAPKSNFVPVSDGQSKDKKQPSAEWKDKESADITLDVFK